MNGIKEINNEILRVTNSVVVHRREFSKFGGYEGYSDIYTMDIAEALYNAGYRKMPENMGDFSDGYHTFNELYHHRAVLFSALCNMMPEKAWKSKLHDAGDMFDGMFIVGIETEQGQATYHYDIEPYWDMFKVKELERAPKWDGHTPSDAIERIGTISSEVYRKQIEGEWIGESDGYADGEPVYDVWHCSECNHCIDDGTDDADLLPNYCPNCGAHMRDGEKTPKTFFYPEEVRKMSQREVRENYQAIMDSMKEWK